MSQGFEDRAADWIRFAGAERHDAYWAYRDAFFELLPASPATTLEVGYGEGRVPRDLRALGHDVTGLDASPTLVGAARDADPGGTYVVGDALALPFGDGAFDLVVAYNSLIDVEDMPVAVAGAGRVLRPGGCFWPACRIRSRRRASSGRDARATFVVEGSYLEEAGYELLSDRDGIVFRFASRRFPLESYARALEAVGLAITALREPPLPGAAVGRRTRIPLFLMWRAVKGTGSE